MEQKESDEKLLMLQDNYTQLYDYCVEHSVDTDQLLYELDRETHLKTLNPRMSSGPMQGKILSLISHLVRPKRILEIGTFTGYSTLHLVRGLENEGKLITIEINPELSYISNKYFKLSPHGHLINPMVGNALEIIPTLDESFDLIFMDAAKKDYPAYYELVLPKMPSGGLILADNVLWSGQIIAAKKDKNAKALDAFNKMVKADDRVENIILPLRDGINVIRKK